MTIRSFKPFQGKRGQFAKLRCGLSLILLAGTIVRGQAVTGNTPEGASIEGRVLNTTNREFLGKARILVSGTTLETFSKEDGTYRLSNVPPGRVSITAYYTSLDPQTTQLTVTPGQTARHDFSLQRGTPDGTPVTLD